MTDPAKEFKDALGGDVVIPGVEKAGALSATEVLATRSWFERHRGRLTSTGGRPTNPEWTMRRLVPMAPSTWERLEALAEWWSKPDRQVGAGQVAAFLLEDAVSLAILRAIDSKEPEEERRYARQAAGRYEVTEDLEPRFRNWERPELFFGTAA